MPSRAPSIVFLLAAPLSTAAWLRVASPQIEVFTDAGERSGRALVARFDEIRSIFQVAAAAGHAPVRVFEFSSEAEFHAYHDTVAGFYQSGPERDYIALYAGANTGHVAFHEYVHLVLSHSPAPLPRWFEEGTAELYSTLSRSGARWRVGELIDPHLATLKQTPWLSAAQLESATSQEFQESERRGMFYAECWALVHMLNLSPQWRTGMPQFVLLLADGRDDAGAFQAAFGRTMEQAVRALPSYVQLIRAVTVGDAAPRSTATVRVEPVPPVQAALALADLALQVDRPRQAHRLIDVLVRDHPGSPEVIAAAGALARAEGRNDQARKLLKQAIDQGSRDAATYFEYAMAEQEAGATNPHMEELLARVIELDPEFADAQFLLGVRETDDGSYPAAIAHLKIATNARPRRSDYWHALGYAQTKAGRAPDALASARRALATAANAGEEGMAQGLIALAQEHPPTPATRRPAVVVPPSWTNPKGDARVEGTLIRFDCEDHGAKMLVRTVAGADIVLNVLHPNAIELVNAPASGYQFACGAQSIPMIVEYSSPRNDVTRIEFLP